MSAGTASYANLLSNSAVSTATGAISAIFYIHANSAQMIGLTTGTADVNGNGELLNCSGTCNAGEVVKFTGLTTVATLGTGLLQTNFACVVVVGTTGWIKVGRWGRFKVNADAGISAGDLVCSSNTTAGSVGTCVSPTAGTVIGRALEATGGTTANKVFVDFHP